MKHSRTRTSLHAVTLATGLALLASSAQPAAADSGTSFLSRLFTNKIFGLAGPGSGGTKAPTGTTAPTTPTAPSKPAPPAALTANQVVDNVQINVGVDLGQRRLGTNASKLAGQSRILAKTFAIDEEQHVLRIPGHDGGTLPQSRPQAIDDHIIVLREFFVPILRPLLVDVPDAPLIGNRG